MATIKATAQVTVARIIDIESVTRYYKAVSSTSATPSKPTTNPPSGWTTTEPNYTSAGTNTLYYTDLTVFTNGSFSYTDVSKATSYEAAKEAFNKAQATSDNLAKNYYTKTDTDAKFKVTNDSITSAVSKITTVENELDNLSVGGRNLLLNTDKLFKRDNMAPNLVSTSFHVPKEKNAELIGKTLTASYYVYAPGERDKSLSSDTELNNRFGMHMNIEYADSTGVLAVTRKYPFTKYLKTTATTRGRVSGTFTLTPPDGYDTINRISLGCQMYAKPSADNGETWEIGYPKLEIGNTATDWTPAPEDVEGEIENCATKTELSSAITQTAEEIATKVSKDGIISAINQTAESVKIKAEKISLEGTVTANENFKINTDGSMEATAGTIGGWTIENGKLSAETDVGVKSVFQIAPITVSNEIIKVVIESNGSAVYLPFCLYSNGNLTVLEIISDTVFSGNPDFTGVPTYHTSAPAFYTPNVVNGQKVATNIFTGQIDTAGYVTNSSTDVHFSFTLSRPLVDVSKVTISSAQGFKIRQNGKYLYGSGANTYVAPSSISTTLEGDNILRVVAKFSDTTNVTNNATVGIEGHFNILII